MPQTLSADGAAPGRRPIVTQCPRKFRAAAQRPPRRSDDGPIRRGAAGHRSIMVTGPYPAGPVTGCHRVRSPPAGPGRR
eukprot:306338-Hanusia_phi.AAC.1